MDKKGDILFLGEIECLENFRKTLQPKTNLISSRIFFE